MRFWFGVLFSALVVMVAGCKATHRNSEMKMKDTKLQGSGYGSKDDANSVSYERILCQLGSDERQILRRKPEAGGCEVVYVKSGEEKAVANALNDLHYCDKIMGRIESNLKDAGFFCKGE